MEAARSRLLRQLPAVDELLRAPFLKPFLARLSRPWATEVVRRTLGEKRHWLCSCPQEELPPKVDVAALLQELGQALEQAARYSLVPVINATGVIIHTNLGRSPLAVSAQEQILAAAAHYTNLEYHLAQGERGSRQDLLEGLLKELTGVEAALVVNNNAAAVLLALQALAAGREVIISRGQLVEIGGC